MSPWLRDPLAPWRQTPKVLLLSADQQVREWPHGQAAGAKPYALAFGEWCAQHRDKACVIIAGADSLCAVAPAAADPWPGPEAASAYARQMLAHFHGDGAFNWPLWLWHSTKERSPRHWGASAMLPAGKDTLDAVAKAHGVRIQAIWPLWALALEQAGHDALETTAALMVHEPGWITRLDLQAGGLCRVAHRRVSDDSARGSTSDEPGHVVIHSTLPEWAWAAAPAGLLNPHEIDPPNRPQVRLPDVVLQACPRQGQQTRTPPLAWVTLAGALIGTAVLTWDAWVAHQAAATTLVEQARWQQARATAEAALQRPAGTPAPIAPDAGGDGNALAAPSKQVAEKLAHPWDRVLHAVESASDGRVQWLRLEHDAETSTTRLEGAATDVSQAIATAGRLKDSGAWRAAWLARVASAKDATGLRFEVEATGPVSNPPAGARP